MAAVLACLLPQAQRDSLRKSKVDAAKIISLFHFDHIHLHSQGGSDEWWNLDPKLAEVHKEKSRRDTSIAAKSKRIDAKWQEFMRAMAEGRKPSRRPSKWPKRKFPKRQSGFRSVKVSQTAK